jgi:hypothetical protein
MCKRDENGLVVMNRQLRILPEEEKKGKEENKRTE